MVALYHERLAYLALNADGEIHFVNYRLPR